MVLITPKEQATLRLLGRGLAPKDIAKAQHVSVETTRCHLQSLRSKLGAVNMVQLVRISIEHGLIAPPELLAYPKFKVGTKDRAPMKMTPVDEWPRHINRQAMADDERFKLCC